MFTVTADNELTPHACGARPPERTRPEPGRSACAGRGVEVMEGETMNAEFVWRGVEYIVSGWLWAVDGEHNGMIVRRADGKRIRGATMHPGMVQLGLSAGLERAAARALTAAREAEREGVR